MKIDSRIIDIHKICMKKLSQKTKWAATLNAQYIHQYAGIRNEGGVGRV